jgi:uncharacterized protein (TIGR03067 family)
MRHTVAVLLLAAVATAAPVPKSVKAKRPDAEVFVGTWELQEGNNGGQKWAWTFDEDLTMWSQVVGANGRGSKWVMKIDPDKSPKEIDFDGGGTKWQGIYEIDGDEIRMVYNNPRPANFDNKARNNYTVLRRVEKK